MSVMSCASSMSICSDYSECSDEQTGLLSTQPTRPVNPLSTFQTVYKPHNRNLLRNDMPYMVNNFSKVLNLIDWIVVQDIFTHSNLCIISIHANGKYIFNVTLVNNRVYAINDKMVDGKTIIRKLPGNSYLIEIPSRNFQLQFTYNKPIRFRYNNKTYKYLTVISRFYVKGLNYK